VKREVRRRIADLGKDGGYILSGDHNILINVPPENVVAMLEGAIEYGRYLGK
jgi:uroporphyrinogen-III decarboxylase